jgi:molybdate transport system substrate-binding protein
MLAAMPFFRPLLLAGAMLFAASAHAGKITIAAAADLKFAMDEIVATFQRSNSADRVDVIYGSSGKFHAQIQRGAPYDLYFSADIAFPRALAKAGFAASEVRPYAVGRIVLWSAAMDARQMTLASLTDARVARVAVANPRHAPYGKRAEEALRAAGLWDKVEPKLVYGENIAHAAQFVQSGNAQVGVIALALAVSPELAGKGGYWLIPDHLHAPLEQGFIITRRLRQRTAQRLPITWQPAARAVMTRYGFVLPGEAAGVGPVSHAGRAMQQGRGKHVDGR